MSHYPIPEDARRLAVRLRMLADEIESAARYGVPIPSHVTVGGHKHGGASFAASPEEFDAWVDYTEAEVREYEYQGADWRSVDRIDVNGLPLTFSTSSPSATVTR